MHDIGRITYQCPDAKCTASFPRKDYMTKHVQGHQRFQCSHNHCHQTVFDFERDSHVAECHGPYECPIASCHGASRSYFAKSTLRVHLLTAHGINPREVDHMDPRDTSAWTVASSDCNSCSHAVAQILVGLSRSAVRRGPPGLQTSAQEGKG